MSVEVGINNKESYMKKCPTCGVLLYGRLVDAIVNPYRNESCPKAKSTKISLINEVDTTKKRSPLFTALLFGSMMNDKINRPDE